MGPRDWSPPEPEDWERQAEDRAWARRSDRASRFVLWVMVATFVVLLIAVLTR